MNDQETPLTRALNLHNQARLEFTTQHVLADTSNRPAYEKREAAEQAWKEAKVAALRRGETDEFPKFTQAVKCL